MSSTRVRPGCQRGRILVLQHQEGLGGIVERLVAGRHLVMALIDWRGAVEHLASGPPFDAIVCDVPEARAAYDAVSKVDARQARRFILLVGSTSSGSIRDLPNPRLARPFAWSELRAAIEDVVSDAATEPAP